jgi:hypothetical protein
MFARLLAFATREAAEWMVRLVATYLLTPAEQTGELFHGGHFEERKIGCVIEYHPTP